MSRIKIALCIFFIMMSFAPISDGAEQVRALDGWLEDANGYARALDEYLTSEKMMIVYFHASWCPYCRELEKNVLTKTEVQDFLEDKIKVRINAEKSDREAKIAEKYGIRGYPSVFVHGSSVTGSAYGAQKMQQFRTPSFFIREFEAIREVYEKKAGKKKQVPLKAASSSLKKPDDAEVVPTHLLILNTGQEIIGRLLSDSSAAVRFETADAGELEFRRSDVALLEEI